MLPRNVRKAICRPGLGTRKITVSIADPGVPGFDGANMPQEVSHQSPVTSDASSDTAIAILLEASEAAATHTLDFESLMVALARLVRKIVDYEIYSLLLPDGNGELRVAHSVGYGEDLARSLRIPSGAGLTGRAASTASTIRVDDVRREPGYLQAIDAVRSELAVPLVARDRVVAVLDLQSANRDAFDSRVSEMLELVASRFSLAIDVSQLYQAQQKQHSTLQALQQIAQDFSQILNLEELLEKISSLVGTLMPYDAFAIYLKNPYFPSLTHYFGVDSRKRVRWTDVEIGVGLVGATAESRAPVLVTDTTRDPRYVECMPGINSEVAIPLLLKNQLIGVLDLESTKPAHFSDEDLHMLMLLAPQIAAAVENARLYEDLERDLVAARSVQRHMLPEGRRQAPGVDIAARNVPAAMVSGDFYDFYDLDGSTGILIGDVSGKGAAAALYAGMANGLARSAAQLRLSPGKTLSQVNQWLLDRRIEARYLAALLAVWNPDERRLTMAAAGMPFPYLFRGGSLGAVRLSGVPLGLIREARYEDVTLDLSPGDLIVSTSDGFGESFNSEGKEYGEGRVEAVLRDNLDALPLAILDRLFEDVEQFTAGCPQSDDRTAVVMRVTP